MLFGKLPAHGDFVARGLGAAERDAIDGWLAASLDTARDALGAAFDDAYDSAPPWRFGAVDDDGGVAAAIAPSVDAVGRRFPIVVIRKGLPVEAVASAAEECEDLLFTALGEGWTADRLVDAVGSLDPPRADPWVGQARWWTLGGERFAPADMAGHRPPAILHKVLTMDPSL